MQRYAGYNATALILHWLLFALLCGAWILGQHMVGMPLSPQKLRYFAWHKWLGVTIFALALFRLWWHAAYPGPELPVAMSMWQRRSVQATHALLYVLTVLIPFVGHAYGSAAGVPTVYLGIIPLPDVANKNEALAHLLKQAHVWLNWTLVVLVVLHTIGALKHHLVDCDEVLKRMLPFLERRHRGANERL